MRASKYNLEVVQGERVLLVNLFSRAVLDLDLTSYDYFKLLSRGTSVQLEDDDDREFLEALIGGLFLIDDQRDEDAELRKKVHSERHDPDVLALVIAPTMGCNFGCHYCFEDRPKNEISADAEEQLFRLVERQLPGRKALTVQWFGGEPLLALPSLQRISERLIAMAHGQSAEYSAAIVTNGFYLSPDVAILLKNLGVRSAQITLDGDKRLHDRTRIAGNAESSYETILNYVLRASIHLDIRLRIHVAPFSVSNVKQLLVDLAQRGIGQSLKEIYFAPLFNYKPQPQPQPFAPDSKRFFDAESFAKVEVDLFQDLERLGLPMPDLLEAPFSVCTAVRENALVIGPSGALYKCYFDLDQAKHAVGTLETGVARSATLAKWLDHEIARDEECRACKFLPICFGGCSHKWHDGAPKSVICTRLRYNADKLLPIVLGAATGEASDVIATMSL